MVANLFPLGVAEGEAFCNRVKERRELGGNINNGDDTVISAPRRYGKSSLIKKVVTDMQVPYAWIDFLTVSTKDEVQSQIAKLVAQAIYAISPDVKKIQSQLGKVFKGLGSEISIGLNVGSVVSAGITLHPDFEKKLHIEETLLKLDELALALGKRIVFVFDEFQQVSLLKEGAVIEGMIRHAVERSKAVTYVFSGSNRHLLLSMFSSSSRALYRLCQTMLIERIDAKEYKIFLNELAKEKWETDLEDGAFEKIMHCSERHPFYVNAICNKLWKECESSPNASNVEEAWAWFVSSNKISIVSDIIDLSANQKRIINCLATDPTSEIRGKTFLLKAKLSPSSIVQSVKALEAKDIIYRDEDGDYRILDPAIRFYLLNH